MRPSTLPVAWSCALEIFIDTLTIRGLTGIEFSLGTVLRILSHALLSVFCSCYDTRISISSKLSLSTVVLTKMFISINVQPDFSKYYKYFSKTFRTVRTPFNGTTIDEPLTKAIAFRYVSQKFSTVQRRNCRTARIPDRANSFSFKKEKVVGV